jgi:hypothetical protein
MQNIARDPEVTIVIPALNEELHITEFVTWCRESLDREGIRGEALTVDSSTVCTAERALAFRARMLNAPKRGLGRANIDACRLKTTAALRAPIESMLLDARFGRLVAA